MFFKPFQPYMYFERALYDEALDDEFYTHGGVNVRFFCVFNPSLLSFFAGVSGGGWFSVDDRDWLLVTAEKLAASHIAFGLVCVLIFCGRMFRSLLFFEAGESFYLS